ncbi:MAG: DUF1648 domain-containing protein [Candidatus Sulfotelmatobacter sp.]
MSRDWNKTAIWLAWLALPVTALNYWLAWDRLPMRMAVHFDANFQPNGYASKQGAMEFGLGIVVAMLVLPTVVTLISRAVKPLRSWPTLMISYFVLIFLCYGNYSVIRFNLNLLAPHPPPVNIKVPE